MAKKKTSMSYKYIKTSMSYYMYIVTYLMSLVKKFKNFSHKNV